MQHLLTIAYTITGNNLGAVNASSMTLIITHSSTREGDNVHSGSRADLAPKTENPEGDLSAKSNGELVSVIIVPTKSMSILL